MRDTADVQRIRELWLALPEAHRRGFIDIMLFKGELMQDHPELLDGVTGSITDHLRGVLRGLYQ